jgi:acylphosphatase
MNIRIVVIITGEKQKGLRDKIGDLAKELGIKGEVYYLAKSRKIKAIFEGEEQRVNGIINEIVYWMKGPEGTKLKEIEANAEPYKGNFTKFLIIVPPECFGLGS